MISNTESNPEERGIPSYFSTLRLQIEEFRDWGIFNKFDCIILIPQFPSPKIINIQYLIP